jgi:hypothetical protein
VPNFSNLDSPIPGTLSREVDDDGLRAAISMRTESPKMTNAGTLCSPAGGSCLFSFMHQNGIQIAYFCCTLSQGTRCRVPR